MKYVILLKFTVTICFKILLLLNCVKSCASLKLLLMSLWLCQLTPIVPSSMVRAASQHQNLISRNNTKYICHAQLLDTTFIKCNWTKALLVCSHEQKFFQVHTWVSLRTIVTQSQPLIASLLCGVVVVDPPTILIFSLFLINWKIFCYYSGTPKLRGSQPFQVSYFEES